MAAKNTAKKEETVNATFRIDVELASIGLKTTYMVVTGIPKDLPPEMEKTISAAAEQRFVDVLRDSKFVEFYDYGKTAKDQRPVFYNTNQLASIKVTDISKVE